MEEILKVIAGKMHCMPVDDITGLEKDIAEILVKSGYLKVEEVSFQEGSYLEYVKVF